MYDLTFCIISQEIGKVFLKKSSITINKLGPPCYTSIEFNVHFIPLRNMLKLHKLHYKLHKLHYIIVHKSNANQFMDLHISKFFVTFFTQNISKL